MQQSGTTYNKKKDLKCYHCGDVCTTDDIAIDDKIFCCNGCKTVYEILNQNDMCSYYSIDENPGISQKESVKRNYDFLDDKDTVRKLIDFTNGKLTQITLYIPTIHCSSCIWILENLTRLDGGILHSQVNFLKKKVTVKYSEEKTTIKNVVNVLDSIGYEPLLTLEDKEDEAKEIVRKDLYYKIGVTGFAFGNIMLLSFPEYLTADYETETMSRIFSFLNVVLALPVFFYGGSEYFSSAIKGLKKRIFNIDVPISLGILVLFLRSLYEVVTFTGAGYFDSLAGLIFFLLIGKAFQSKTYEALNFERNYKSYFPISVHIKKEGKESSLPVEKLDKGTRILIKNNEIIPADSVLISETANIDYSFVTGESEPQPVINGDIIYAGGRQAGSAVEVETIKDVSQSYLTQLWNNKAFSKKDESSLDTITNPVSKYFTFVILAIAIGSFGYWFNTSTELAFNALTAVLIIACPCALALSSPFTLGNTMRIFGRCKFYIKNTTVIERLSKISSIVFDKTGTLTESKRAELKFEGNKLSTDEINAVYSIVLNSSHPLSGNLTEYLKEAEKLSVSDYNEIAGKGISGVVNGLELKLGSKQFTGGESKNIFDINTGSKVYLSINGIEKGYFSIKSGYRNGLNEIIKNLSGNYGISLLTGDNDSEKPDLLKIFPGNAELKFRQSPQDKLEFILNKQKNNEKILMIGDGLNDAGALKQSDVGISISENINNFSPACDGILDASSFSYLNKFINFSKVSIKIIIASFIISFLYNVIGISFAVQGTLSPVIAAILMPLSSITVVVFTTITTNFLAKYRGMGKCQ